MNTYRKSDIPAHLLCYFREAEIGSEPTPAAFVAELVAVFREVRRVLKDDGTVWLNLGDSYANDTKWGGHTSGKHTKALHGGTEIGRSRTNTGLPSKSLIGIPWRVAFALQDDGWILRQDIIWHKPNPMPESVNDRCTKAHEYIFLLSKSPKYYFNHKEIQEPATSTGSKNSFARESNTCPSPVSTSQHRPEREPIEYSGTRNKRSVWTVGTKAYKEAHFATFPPALIEPCILAGSRPDDLVLDPFNGSGTTGEVALKWGRKYIGCELNPDYVEITHRRLRSSQLQIFA